MMLSDYESDNGSDLSADSTPRAAEPRQQCNRWPGCHSFRLAQGGRFVDPIRESSDLPKMPFGSTDYAGILGHMGG
jgi:hypothetical protein